MKNHENWWKIRLMLTTSWKFWGKNQNLKEKKIASGKITYKPAPIMPYDRSYRCRISRVRNHTRILEFSSVPNSFWEDIEPRWDKFSRDFGNFRKSPRLKSRYLQNYFDFFKKFWCFGKPMDSTFELCELERLARYFFKFLGGVDLANFRKFTFTAPLIV